MRTTKVLKPRISTTSINEIPRTSITFNTNSIGIINEILYIQEKTFSKNITKKHNLNFDSNGTLTSIITEEKDKITTRKLKYHNGSIKTIYIE